MRKWKIETLVKLKNAGYKYIAAIVHSHFASRYYNVQRIDDIINNGGVWIANSGINGTISTAIDWNVTILRKEVKDND